MKKRIFLFVFLFFFFIPAVNADEFAGKYGTGTIHLELKGWIALDLWESPDDKVPSHFIEVRRDSAYPTLLHFTFDNMKQDSFPSWFKPLIFHIDIENSRLDFNCLGEEKDYYKTNLRCESGKFIWIQKSEKVRFLNWFDFYRSVASVEYRTDTLMLYQKPVNKSQPFPFITPFGSHGIQIIPLEIKGMWMKADVIKVNEESGETTKETGWIYWRNEKEPLIKFNLVNC